jgi:hypothetical protein
MVTGVWPTLVDIGDSLAVRAKKLFPTNTFVVSQGNGFVDRRFQTHASILTRAGVAFIDINTFLPRSIIAYVANAGVRPVTIVFASGKVGAIV